MERSSHSLTKKVAASEGDCTCRIYFKFKF